MVKRIRMTMRTKRAKRTRKGKENKKAHVDLGCQGGHKDQKKHAG